VPKARGLASRLMQESEGYRTRVVESAQGDASRFRQVLAEYQKAPAVTRDRMYIETMQQVFNNTTKVLVDSRQGNQLLYLPFDKLVQQAMQDSGAPRAAPAPVPEPPPVDPSRSRDTSLRSRDREAR
jgi:membrane protease subunit HflK